MSTIHQLLLIEYQLNKVFYYGSFVKPHFQDYSFQVPSAFGLNYKRKFLIDTIILNNYTCMYFIIVKTFKSIHKSLGLIISFNTDVNNIPNRTYKQLTIKNNVYYT